MFPIRYFPSRYFANRYWPAVGADSRCDFITENDYLRFDAPYSGVVTTIYVPNPEFSDTKGLASSINFVEAMDGTLFATKITNEDHQITFSWSGVTKQKMVEIQEFVKAFIGVYIKLTDHRNRIWKLVILDIPAEFTVDNLRLNPTNSLRNEVGSLSITMVGRLISG